jgi:hypothetical protein
MMCADFARIRHDGFLEDPWASLASVVTDKPIRDCPMLIVRRRRTVDPAL